MAVIAVSLYIYITFLAICIYPSYALTHLPIFSFLFYHIGTTKSTNVYLAKDVSVAVHPKSTARPQPNKETRTREGPKKESPRTAYLEKESRRRGSPGKERNESDELNLIANFDPLAIEGFYPSLLYFFCFVLFCFVSLYYHTNLYFVFFSFFSLLCSTLVAA